MNILGNTLWSSGLSSSSQKTTLLRRKACTCNYVKVKIPPNSFFHLQLTMKCPRPKGFHLLEWGGQWPGHLRQSGMARARWRNPVWAPKSRCGRYRSCCWGSICCSNHGSQCEDRTTWNLQKKPVTTKPLEQLSNRYLKLRKKSAVNFRLTVSMKGNARTETLMWTIVVFPPASLGISSLA